ncbi:hypothetical protein F9L00_03460 [Brucella anthropi]|uniref:hypothetical protein n=1 Tax=Brucella/Ochrobactrum group TaxID=2826938 RepID=UPI00124E2E2B|nr:MULTISPECIES: hypothetical protein [Brucella/Ochrobactrum group]KAB2764791.1 hypothetical protein F9K98_01205 [Brucella anthropi]KAB2782538.1 hypothetical protein F9L00_03460 [Brucella anthropi]MCQ9143336.1 hypothetical protein [Ochrobactrum sp. BTU2]UGQ23870.1 hypothetical protein LRL11_16570 [Brucella anthropi]
MKKIVATAAVMATLVSPAFAVDDAAFQSAVMKCWNTPVSFEDAGRFVLAVEIDGEGTPIDITATDYVKGGSSRALGDTLKRAVMRCAPYKFPAAVYSITLNAKKGGKSLKPFKN